MRSIQRTAQNNIQQVDAVPYPVLSVRNLVKRFGGQTVLNDVSVDLREGEIVLLRGNNGAGKTTLLNILTGNLEPDQGTISVSLNISDAEVKEQFRFPHTFWTNLNPFNHFTPERIAREGVGRTWQELRLFTRSSLLNNIAVATPSQLGENPLMALLRPRAVRKEEQEIQDQSRVMLWKLGLEGRENSPADGISLGQSKRVAIARAVQAGARILFLDEPLAGLDRNGVNEVLALLRELALSRRITLVIIEHVFNIPHILNIADTVWTLKDGNLTCEKPELVHSQIVENADHNFTQWIERAVGVNGSVTQMPLYGGAKLSIIRRASNRSGPGAPVLQIRDLCVHRGKRLVVGQNEGENGTKRGLSFTLKEGDLALLQAPNGWGKTTLLEALAGLTPHTQGQIDLGGKSIERKSVWERVTSGLVFMQSRDHDFPSLTVAESLMLSKVTEIPHGLSSFLKRRVSALSGGEKQRLAAFRTLRRNNLKVALFDEPFSALDPARISELTKNMLSCLDGGAMLVAIPSILE